MVIDIWVALPELVLAVCGLGLLMLGVFLGERSFRAVSWTAFAALLIVFTITIMMNVADTPQAFNGLFRTDAFAVFMKALVLIGSMTSIVLSLDYFDREKIARFEFPVLVVFATVGMMIMGAANDLLTPYIGLQLESLSLYVVAAIRGDDPQP